MELSSGWKKSSQRVQGSLEWENEVYLDQTQGLKRPKFPLQIVPYVLIAVICHMFTMISMFYSESRKMSLLDSPLGLYNFLL